MDRSLVPAKLAATTQPWISRPPPRRFGGASVGGCPTVSRSRYRTGARRALRRLDECSGTAGGWTQTCAGFDLADPAAIIGAVDRRTGTSVRRRLRHRADVGGRRCGPSTSATALLGWARRCDWRRRVAVRRAGSGALGARHIFLSAGVHAVAGLRRDPGANGAGGTDQRHPRLCLGRLPASPSFDAAVGIDTAGPGADRSTVRLSRAAGPVPGSWHRTGGVRGGDLRHAADGADHGVVAR